MIETVSKCCSYFTFFGVYIRDFTAIKTIFVVLLLEFWLARAPHFQPQESHQPWQGGKPVEEIASIASVLLLPFCALPLNV